MRDGRADAERLGSVHRMMRYSREETLAMTHLRHSPCARAALLFAFLAAAAATTGCGKKKPAQAADAIDTTEASPKKDPDATEKPEASPQAGGAGSSSGGGGGDGTETAAPKKDECVGFEMGNLDEVLNKIACEAPLPKIDDKALDPKDRLEVKLSASPLKVAPGQHADLYLSFTNKTKQPLPLTFTIDPTPRFEVETYDAKSKRVDMPSGNPPPLPKGMAARTPGEPKGARITLAPNGTARIRIGWDAVKMKWAPDKVRGTPPERGYPRTAAGPLAKGKYTIRVVSPLVGVLEGVDHEVSAPKLPIEVGN